MKRSTQVRSNPFPYSDSNKRYHTYDYYLKQTFGGKCAKIPLDAGTFSDSARIQTWNRLIRSQVLYSVELRSHLLIASANML